MAEFMATAAITSCGQIFGSGTWIIRNGSEVKAKNHFFGTKSSVVLLTVSPDTTTRIGNQTTLR